MQAIVKQTCVWSTVKAFSGLELTKNEWRNVPAGHEAEALRHPMLDTRAKQTVIAGIEPINATKSAVAYADEHDIDLSGLVGTGTGSKITLNDVRKAAKV